MFLETERLLLRNWQESDVDGYLVLAGDVGYNCFSRPGRFLVHSAAEAQEKIHERMKLFDESRLGKFPVFLKQGGEFIGTCGIGPFDMDGHAEVELGYRLCLRHWGRGYAAEAAAAVLKYGFCELDFERIMALALPQNRASLRILEKLGFRYLRDFDYAGFPHRLHEISRKPALA
jgi:ribosomal-protein-alanine N-acetyltransferase